jgi:hypothetical protein
MHEARLFRRILDLDRSLRVVIVDSITQLDPTDAGAIVVAASHGGVSSGEFALAVPLRAVFFNDAGIGKDDAGIAALRMLDARGIAAGAVSHATARIGDARDMWEHGVLSRVNPSARRLGLAPGDRLQSALQTILQPISRETPG